MKITPPPKPSPPTLKILALQSSPQCWIVPALLHYRPKKAQDLHINSFFVRIKENTQKISLIKWESEQNT